MKYRNRKLLKGAAAGLAGGLAGTVVMTLFQKGWSAAATKLNSKRDESRNENIKSRQPAEDSTMKVAGKLAKAVGTELTHQQKKTGGNLVHYGFGTALGCLYGSGLECAPWRMKRNHMLNALTFGSAVFLAADEVVLPALKLSSKLKDKSFSEHAYGLASHLIYGVAVGLAVKTVRNLL